MTPAKTHTTQAHAALTRRLMLLADPVGLRPVADADSLEVDRPAQARREIARLLAQATAHGLTDRRAIEHGLTSEEPAQRLAACQAVARCLREEEACTPLAVDWLVFAHDEKQAPPGLLAAGGAGSGTEFCGTV